MLVSSAATIEAEAAATDSETRAAAEVEVKGPACEDAFAGAVFVFFARGFLRPAMERKERGESLDGEQVGVGEAEDDPPPMPAWTK